MPRLRWIIVVSNASLVAAISLCLLLPIPRIKVLKPDRIASITSFSPFQARDIAAPDLDRFLFRSFSKQTDLSGIEEVFSAPELRLAGVIVSDDTRIALIEQQGSFSQRVSEGDEIDGWIVAEIQARSITLTRQAQGIVYPLDSASEKP